MPVVRNNLSNDTRSSGDDDADNFNKNEGTMLDDDNDYDESFLDGGNDSGNSMTIKGGDNSDSGRSHNSTLLDVGTLFGRKNTSTSTFLEDDIIFCKASYNNAILPKTDNNVDGTNSCLTSTSVHYLLWKQRTIKQSPTCLTGCAQSQATGKYSVTIVTVLRSSSTLGSTLWRSWRQ